MGRKVIDLRGKRFGRLTVIERAENIKLQPSWLCKCDCGNEIIVRGGCLRENITKSCGCFQREVSRLINTTHGMKREKPYMCWEKMKRRCKNTQDTSYIYYGARGIKVCDKWQTFEGFWDDMKDGYSEGLTIERISSNGNYCKENCRWATRREQANNRRSNRIETYHGTTDTLSNLCRLFDKKYANVKKRIHYGCDIEKAMQE